MYPAYTAIGRDIGLGFARWKVYMALQPPVLDFVSPKPIKAVWLAREAHISRRKVIDALDWLTARGYLLERSRDSRGVRSLTLAYSLNSEAA